MAKLPHALLFPFQEQSHVTPMFAFGRALASRGVLVTCVLPASRYHTSFSSGLFRVEAIPDGDDTDDLRFQLSFRRLEAGLDELMHRLQPRPSCLVSDLLYPWSQDLADRHGVPRFQFSPYPALSYLVALHLPDLVAKGLLPFQPGMENEAIDFIPGLIKGFQLVDVPMDFLKRSAKELEIIFQLHNSKRGAGLVINTAYELEPDALDALSSKGLSLFPVGPMFTIDWNNNLHCDSSLFTEDEECLSWLDRQPRGSVVYASFGSIISLTEKDIQELALGLEACGHPFLWVIRRAANGNPDPTSALPAGFEERTKDRGCVISWAPQTAVLSHPSVGCFLSHCGYGSILEALWTGVPMIGGFYKISDQNTNFKLITDGWGVALPLQDRMASPPRPLRSCIEESVKELMHGERGQKVKQKSAQLKGAIRKAVEVNGCSLLSLIKFGEKLYIPLPVPPAAEEHTH
eukprot:c24694_g1_i2 orf=127-1509(+)